ncbi:hypothetical protein [Niveibacterium microcysteis]|uniref:Rap1a immunity protein domain-containing protein n=1 Tax=Niveibacterium microcysteis TaxID=2811415 RepID=A0ABX7MA49_9RHOO|nr:hypothetical protein [Niveibacterium microcysteis]QSI78607.1 hypothetical protein JY500_08380 [Niveibacterium microcysteis]
MRLTVRVALVLTGLLLGQTAASAHGVHTSPPLAINEDGPLAGGAREALSCDGEISDSVFEYDLCLDSRWPAVEPSADARLGFWLIATLRAYGAAENGYPDAQTYLAHYRERLDATQRETRAPVVQALCQALALRCPLGL